MQQSMALEAAIEEAKKILESKSLSGWEVFAQEVGSLEVEVRDSAVESFQASVSSGIGVRVIRQTKVGFAHTSNFSTDSLGMMIDSATAAALEVSEDPFVGLPQDTTEPAELDLTDSRIKTISEDDKIAQALTLEKTAMDADPKIKRVRGAEYSEHEARVFLINSNGLSREGQTTMFTASVMTVAEANGDSQVAHEFDFSHFYDKLDPVSVAKNAANRALGLLGGKPMPSCKCPVILCAEAAAELLGVTSNALTSEAVDKGKSWLAGKDGQDIFSPSLTIVDDGTHKDAPWGLAFDGEGVACRKTILVDKGKLANFMFDTYYARKMDSQSTGNGVRSEYTETPCPGTTAIYIEPGTKSREDLLASVDQGFWIDELMGVHMADPISGEFSLGCRGWRISKGKLAEPVTGMAVSGTLTSLWQAVEELGNDLRFFSGEGSPSVLIGRLTLSGQGHSE